jgi:hypothetical protein
MTAQSDIHLTEERIRAVVNGTAGFSRNLRGAARRGAPMSIPPEMLASLASSGGNLLGLLGGQFDAAAGPGAGRFVSDSTRLMELLSYLADGTIEEAIALHQARVPDARMFGDDPALEAQFRFAHERQLADLRAIPRSEVDAVLACLDDIAKVHPREVERIRFRHDPAERERKMGAATALRTGDPSRPPLTDARVGRVLDVLRQLLPVPQKMQAMFGTTYALEGKAAGELLGASVVKKLASWARSPRRMRGTSGGRSSSPWSCRATPASTSSSRSSRG